MRNIQLSQWDMQGRARAASFSFFPIPFGIPYHPNVTKNLWALQVVKFSKNDLCIISSIQDLVDNPHTINFRVTDTPLSSNSIQLIQKDQSKIFWVVICHFQMLNSIIAPMVAKQKIIVLRAECTIGIENSSIHQLLVQLAWHRGFFLIATDSNKSCPYTQISVDQQYYWGTQISVSQLQLDSNKSCLSTQISGDQLLFFLIATDSNKSCQTLK